MKETKETKEIKEKVKRQRKWMATLVMVISVFFGILLMEQVHLFDFLERKAYDFRVNLFAANARPSDDIVVALLDQDSIDWAQAERGWGWPWPRKAYAELLDYMKIAGAKSLAFDSIFSEPSVYGADDDAEFVRAEREFGHVVQTVFFSNQTGNTTAWPTELRSPLLQPDAQSFVTNLSSFGIAESGVKAQFPVTPLRDQAAVIGNVTSAIDIDSTIRHSRLFALFDGKAIPGLSAASLLAGGADPHISYNKQKRAIEWGDYTIPVDDQGKSLLRFRGTLDRYIPYSAKAILQSAEAVARGEEPILFPEDFKDKYVFFGYYAPGLFDICTTPIESVYPGMGVHITMLDNILQQDFIREAPAWLNFIMLFMGVLIIAVLVVYVGRIAFSVSGLILFLGGISVGTFLAYNNGIWVHTVEPLAGVLFTFITGTLYNYTKEGSQKRFIKSAFGQYLSPTIIDQLIANPAQLRLGGERREISIFFSDVQGFTTISEKLDPTQLTELLNEYLTFMSDIIMDSGGTIDKYEGDAIIAFWNAPLTLEDHASRALGAALECQRLLAERQEAFFEKFGCRLLTRIGLNTGFAVVGNMGSNIHFNYTMLGDSVNLAARLEGLNKQFGTYLMCTENTFTKANEHGKYAGRKLAQVAVVGKKEPVTVYEPMPDTEFHQKAAVVKQFDQARDLFYGGKFAEALAQFEAMQDQDKPPAFYAEQCRYFIEHPADWKGFWQASSK
ncbi:MAG: adenylate/guanylate cyclase domain-containing protein [Treponema sp.]|jgi:adenylate cyclase|nr:adenylate/guanylate cyclase domain-containing protein [Treponema sp.]